MSALELKRETLRRTIRKNHHELIRKEIRDQILGKLPNSNYLLVSDTLEDFAMLSPPQLQLHSETIQEVLTFTIYQELSDEEHSRVVTDIYYLVLQKILPELCLTFKKNKDPYTATLVAFMSQEIDPEELLYWIPFMGEEEKSLMFLNIDGLSFSHQKWVSNQQLYLYLLSEIKWNQGAAAAFKSILENSEELSRKQMVESIEYVHMALENQGKGPGKDLHQVLLSIWTLLIAICQKIKETKLCTMVTVLKYHLTTDEQSLLNIDLLPNLIQISRNDPLLYLLEDPAPQKIIALVVETKIKGRPETSSEKDDLYFNYLFQFLYLNWLSRHLNEKSYRYSLEFYNILREFKGKVEGGPFFEKLWKVVC